MADDFRLLRGARVTERGNASPIIGAVCPAGNPMNHSKNSGDRWPPASRGKFRPPFVCFGAGPCSSRKQRVGKLAKPWSVGVFTPRLRP